LPTGDYSAVHIYGDAVVIPDDDGANRDVLEKMIDAVEPEYMGQWHALDAGCSKIGPKQEP
jgi:predicted FMN-binding regulatory protein PaiB